MKRRWWVRWMVLAALAVSIAALTGASGAVADDCPDGWVCGVTEPPVPPDQAGDPQPVIIDWSQIPDVPPAVTVDTGLPAPPKHKACKKKRKQAAAAKKCKPRKRK